MSPSRRIILLVALVTLAVMGPVASHEFTNWDDDKTLFRNPQFNPPSWKGVGDAWTKPHLGLYVPVTYTAWSALAAVAQPEKAVPPPGIGLNPAPFHGFNILVHLGSALLVFAILRLLFKDDTAAGIGALLFALHPVQVEPVAWASGTKDLLCGAFSLLAVWQYLLFARDRQGADAPAGRGKLHYALGLLALVLGMLSKPTAMVVPAIAFVLDFFVFRRPARRVAIALLPWVVVVLPFVVVARVVQEVNPADPTPLWARPLIAGFSLAFYLGKLVAPVRLAFDYGWRPQVLLEKGWIYGVWVIPVAIAVLLWFFRRRASAAVAGALIFVLGLAPLLGLARFQFQIYSTVADHYLHLSLLGASVVVAWAVASVGPSRRRVVVVAAGVVLALLAVRSVLQVRVWRDEFALEEHILSVNPNSFAAYGNLASAWGAEGELAVRQNRPGEAREAYITAANLVQKSIAVAPYRGNYRQGAGILAGVYSRIASLEGSPDARTARLLEGAQKVQGLLQAPSGGPRLEADDRQSIHTATGDLYARAGDFGRAVEQYEKAVQLKPDNAEVAARLRDARQRLNP